MHCDLTTTIPDWIIEHPETLTVFNELGLDVNCSGKSLQFVAIQNGRSPAEVLNKLRECLQQASENPKQNPNGFD